MLFVDVIVPGFSLRVLPGSWRAGLAGENNLETATVHFLLDTTDDIFSPVPVIHFNRALSDEEKVTLHAILAAFSLVHALHTSPVAANSLQVALHKVYVVSI